MKYLALFLILFLIPLASAEVYEKDKAVDIKQTCYNNDFYCSGAAQCLITVVSPQNNVTVSNQSMTNQISFHNYTINTRNTSVSGVYNYCITCRDGAFNASRCFEFTVNPSGIDFSQSRTDALTRSVLILFALGILLAISGFLIQSMPVKYSLWIISFIMFLVVINMTFVTLQEEVVSPRIEGFFDFFTAASFYLYWFAGGLVFVIWFLTIMNSLAGRKQVKDIRRFSGL